VRELRPALPAARALGARPARADLRRVLHLELRARRIPVPDAGRDAARDEHAMEDAPLVRGVVKRPRPFEHYGSMNDRTTRVSIELRYIRRTRSGLLLAPGAVLPSWAAVAALSRAARFLGLPSLVFALARGWLPDLQSSAIASIEGPS